MPFFIVHKSVRFVEIYAIEAEDKDEAIEKFTECDTGYTGGFFPDEDCNVAYDNIFGPFDTFTQMVESSDYYADPPKEK